jgi:rubrerythrin
MENNEVMKKYPKTTKVLLEAFSGESQARNKYDFFAKVARKEGHQKLAEFFEETAKNEFEHAKLLFKLLDGIGDSKGNLQEAINGENYEHILMYPKFAEIAREEGFEKAEFLFNRLSRIEKEHDERFKRLLLELNENTLYSSKTGEKIVWVCRVCGNIECGIEAPEVCPVCNHPRGYFERQQQNY